MVAPTFTPEELRERLHYDPETGIFTWKISPSRNVKAGAKTGSLNGTGYQTIWFNSKSYYGYDLAWYYVYGVWPSWIDHINRIRSDDRIANLRMVDRAQNRHNAKINSNNYAGSKGVRFRYDNMKWQARIQVNGKPMSLGHFATKEQAEEAYKNAAKKFYNEFASTGT